MEIYENIKKRLNLLFCEKSKDVDYDHSVFISRCFENMSGDYNDYIKHPTIEEIKEDVERDKGKDRGV